MNILIYGAGVIGCELAHMLIKAGNHVTLLARGDWKQTLKKNGLVIRHYVQLYTSFDQVNIIDTLNPDDFYDLIFVVMQFGQINQVLPIVAKNHSRLIILVGNNPSAETSLNILKENNLDKEVAFGFQGTGGRRENGKVISVHTGVGMTVGGLSGELSNEFKQQLERAFQGVKYRLTWVSHMDAWLKCHLALILPICYVCYATDCRLTRATKTQRQAILDAALEACVMLQNLGVPIRIEDSIDYFKPGRKRTLMAAMLFILAKTPLGRLAASDHCQNAVSEMSALDDAFERLRQKSAHPMPVWDELRALGKPPKDKIVC